MFLRSLFFGLIIAMPVVASADEDSGPRGILGYGCHKADGTCYVYLDGAQVTGNPGCSANVLRWSSGDVNGKNWLAMIMTAAATGKKVSFFVTGCVDPGFPTFSYGTVYQ